MMFFVFFWRRKKFLEEKKINLKIFNKFSYIKLIFYVYFLKIKIIKKKKQIL